MERCRYAIGSIPDLTLHPHHFIGNEFGTADVDPPRMTDVGGSSLIATESLGGLKMIRSTLLASTALVLFATPVLADCTEEFGNLREKMSTSTVSTEVRRDINQLRSAARILVRYEENGTCEDVISAIQNIVGKRQEKREERREREAELKRYQAATPVADIKGIVRVDNIRGLDIYNLKGEEVGAVEGVTVDADKGDIAYVVVSHGGFLGIGDKLIAVPWKEFRMTKEEDVLVWDVSEKSLETAPGFDEDSWPNMSDPKWRGPVDAYFRKDKRG